MTKIFLILVIALVGTFVTQQIYTSVVDFKFTAAFLGGAIIMSVVSLIIQSEVK